MRGTVICRRCGRTTSACHCTGERSFAVKIFLGTDPETGKERQKWVGGFRSEREAKAHLLEVAVSPAYGSGLGPHGSMRIRLGDYLRDWLQSTQRSISEHEHRTRLSRLRCHILLRPLANVQLARLAPATLQRFVSVDLAELNPTTAHKVFKDLRQALKRAVQLGLITSNPCQAVEAPKPRDYRPTVWTPEELHRFVAACADAGPKGLLFVTAFASGTRQGELLGMQWRYMDLDRGVLSVVQDLERPAGGGFRFGDVKSKYGRRPVRLPQPLAAALRTERARQREERLRRGLCLEGAGCRAPRCRSWHDHDLIFAQVNGKPLHGHNLTRRDLKALCAGAKVPAIRFHDFRHLHNTVLMREGISARVVQERAGHHSTAFTLDRYSWVTPDLQEGAAEALGRSLVGATGMLPESVAVAGKGAGGRTAKRRV